MGPRVGEEGGRKRWTSSWSNMKRDRLCWRTEERGGKQSLSPNKGKLFKDTRVNNKFRRLTLGDGNGGGGERATWEDIIQRHGTDK